MSRDNNRNAAGRQPLLTRREWSTFTFNGKHDNSFLTRGAKQNPRIGFEDLIAFVPSSSLLPFPSRRATSVRCLGTLCFRLW